MSTSTLKQSDFCTTCHRLHAHCLCSDPLREGGYLTIPAEPLMSQHRESNRYKAQAQYTCYLCGKALKNVHLGKTAHVEIIQEEHIVVAGSTSEADQEDPFYRGCYPVGNDCMRRVRKAAREAGITPTI